MQDGISIKRSIKPIGDQMHTYIALLHVLEVFLATDLLRSILASILSDSVYFLYLLLHTLDQTCTCKNNQT